MNVTDTHPRLVLAFILAGCATEPAIRCAELARDFGATDERREHGPVILGEPPETEEIDYREVCIGTWVQVKGFADGPEFARVESWVPVSDGRRLTLNNGMVPLVSQDYPVVVAIDAGDAEKWMRFVESGAAQAWNQPSDPTDAF